MRNTDDGRALPLFLVNFHTHLDGHEGALELAHEALLLAQPLHERREAPLVLGQALHDALLEAPCVALLDVSRQADRPHATTIAAAAAAAAAAALLGLAVHEGELTAGAAAAEEPHAAPPRGLGPRHELPGAGHVGGVQEAVPRRHQLEGRLLVAAQEAEGRRTPAQPEPRVLVRHGRGKGGDRPRADGASSAAATAAAAAVCVAHQAPHPCRGPDDHVEPPAATAAAAAAAAANPLHACCHSLGSEHLAKGLKPVVHAHQ
jgi:hypothetical protein